MKVVVLNEDTKFLIKVPQKEDKPKPIQWLIDEIGRRIRKRELLGQGLQYVADEDGNESGNSVIGELFTKDSLLLDPGDLLEDTLEDGDEVTFKNLSIVKSPMLANVDARVSVQFKGKPSIFRIPQRTDLPYSFGDLTFDAARHFQIDPDSAEIHLANSDKTVILSSKLHVLDEILAFQAKGNKKPDTILSLVLVGNSGKLVDENDPLAVRTDHGRVSPGADAFHPHRSEIARDLILDHRPDFLKEQAREQKEAEEKEIRIKKKTEKLMKNHVPSQKGRSSTLSFPEAEARNRERSHSIEVARPTRQRRGSFVMARSPREGEKKLEDSSEDHLKIAASHALSGAGVGIETSEMMKQFVAPHEHADVWADEKAEWVSRSGFVGPVLATHIPLYVASSTLNFTPRESEHGPGPGKYEMTGVVCFFRISGFAELVNQSLTNCDSGAKHDDAAYLLAKTADELFGRIVDIVRANRGDIISLKPDGVTAYWQPSAKGVESTISTAGKLVLTPPPLEAGILAKAHQIEQAAATKDRFSFRKSKSKDPSSSPPGSPLKPPIIITTDTEKVTTNLQVTNKDHLEVGKKLNMSKSAGESNTPSSPLTMNTRPRRMSQTSDMGVKMKGRLKELQSAEPALGGLRGRGRATSLALTRPRAVSTGRHRLVESTAIESGSHIPKLSSNQAVLAAAQCALDVVSSINGHEYGDNKSATSRVNIRAGIAVGNVVIWRVGGTGASWHNSTIGGAAIEKAKNLTYATLESVTQLSWGSVVATPGSWCSISEVCDGENLWAEEHSDSPLPARNREDSVYSPKPGKAYMLVKNVKEPLIVTPEQMFDAASLFSKQPSSETVLNSHWFLPRKVLGHIFAACSDAALIEGDRPSNGTGLGIEPDLDCVGEQAVLVMRVEIPMGLLHAPISAATSPAQHNQSLGHGIVHRTTAVVQQACLRYGGVIVGVNRRFYNKSFVLSNSLDENPEPDSCVFEFIGIFGMPPFLTESDILCRQASLGGLVGYRACFSVITDMKKNCRNPEAVKLYDDVKISAGVSSGCGFCASVGSITSRREYTVMGPALDRAIELSEDDRGLVLCSEGVRKQAGRWVDFFEVIYSRNDQPTFAVLRESGDPPHPISEPIWHHTGVIGHPRIRAELWHRVRAFAREPSPFSGALLIEGPAGSGKSALFGEVLSAVALEKISAGGDDTGGSVNPYGEIIKGEMNWPVLRVIHCTGEPATRHTPYYAIRMLLGQLYGLDHLTPYASSAVTESTDDRLAKVLSTARTNILNCLKAGTSDPGLISMSPLIDAMLPPGLQVFGQDMKKESKLKTSDTTSAEGFCPDIPPHIRAGIRLDLVFALLRGSANATLNKGNRVPPLLICIEELQWIDSASLRIFAELCADMNPPSLLLALSSTPPNPQTGNQESAPPERVRTSDGIQLSDLGRFVPQWEFGVGRREHGTDWREVAMSVIRDGPYSLALTLAALLEEETSALVCRTIHADTVDRGLARIIHTSSKGNACHAIELAYALNCHQKCVIRRPVKLSNSEEEDDDESTITPNHVPEMTEEKAAAEHRRPPSVFEGSPSLQRVPPTLESALKERLKEMDSISIQVLTAAAVIGFSFRLSAVTALIAATGGVSGISNNSSTFIMLRVRKELKDLVHKGIIEVPRRTRRRALLMAFSEKRVVGPGAVEIRRPSAGDKILLPGSVPQRLNSSEQDQSTRQGLMPMDDEEITEHEIDENELGEVFNFTSEFLHHTLITRCLVGEIKPKWFKAAAEWFLQVGIARIALMPVQAIGADISSVARTSTRMISMRRSITSALVNRAFAKRRSTIDSQASTGGAQPIPTEERLQRESIMVEGLAPFLGGMVRQWFKFLLLPAQKEKIAGVVQAGSRTPGSSTSPEVKRIDPEDRVDYTNYEYYALALNLCSVAGERARALQCPAEALSFFLAGRRIALRGFELVQKEEIGGYANTLCNEDTTGVGLTGMGITGLGSGIMPGDGSSFLGGKQLLRLRAARFTRWCGDACDQLCRYARQSQIKTDPSIEEDAHYWYVKALELLEKPLPNTRMARSLGYWWFKIGQIAIRTVPRCCSQTPPVDSEVFDRLHAKSGTLVPNPVSPGTAIVSVPMLQDTNESDIVAHEELKSLLGIFEMYGRRCEIDASMRYVAVRAFVLAEPRWRSGRPQAVSQFVRACSDMLSLATESGSRVIHSYEGLLESAIGETWTFCLHGPDSHTCFGEILGGISNSIRCQALKELGRAAAAQADWAKAINLLSSACLFYEHIYDREGLGDTAYLLAHALYAVGDFEAARVRFSQSAESAAMVDNEISMVRALSMKSICDVQLDALSSGADSLSEAKEIAGSWKSLKEAHSMEEGDRKTDELKESVDDRLNRKGRDQALLELCASMQIQKHFPIRKIFEKSDTLTLALAFAHSHAGDRSEAFEYVMEPAEILAAIRPISYDSFALYGCSFDIIHDLLEGEHLISYSQAGEYVSERMAQLISIAGKVLAAFEKFVSYFKFAKLRLILWTSLLRSITVSTHAGELALAEAVRFAQKSDDVKMPFEYALLNYHVGRNAVGEARDSHLLKAMSGFKDVGATHYIALTERQLSLSKNVMDAM